MSSTVLIVTEELDIHADIVVSKLQAMGETPFRLHTANFPQSAKLDFSLEAGELQGALCDQGRELALRDIRSVWWRRPGDYQVPDDLSEQEADFVGDELNRSLRGMWAALDCYWLSHPDAIRNANHKLEQLQRAAKFGFDTPRTLVTMNPQAVRTFYDECAGQVIYKSFSQPMLPSEPATNRPARTIYTALLTQEHLESLAAVERAPCLFQAYAPKQLELRVTVVEDQVFAAAIHSQEDERTKHDWRHYEADIPYTAYDLPEALAEKCVAFVRSYNLNFSALDFVLTPDGRYVFLENNPNGQWYFIEHAVPELEILNAVTDCLVRGPN